MKQKRISASSSKYLTNGMHLVYLDQCVLSRFLERPENEQWRELREVILHGNANRRILCPTSMEHLAETASLPNAADAVFLDDLLRKLSFGWTLLPDPELITEQIIAKVRNRPLSRHQFLRKHHLRPINTPELLAKLREQKAQMDKHNAWLMQGVNEINAICHNGRKADGDARRLLVNHRTSIYVNRLWAEVSGSLKTGRVVVRADEHNPDLANWESLVVFKLITESRITLAESQRICRLLRNERLEFIPTLKIKAELEAIQFCRKEQIEPRDQYDITRAACGLPYADVFITDGGKASAIREMKLDTFCRTKVFSMKKSELPALIARLREIVG